MVNTLVSTHGDAPLRRRKACQMSSVDLGYHAGMTPSDTAERRSLIDRKELLLEAGLKLLEEHPGKEMTFAAVAERAGVAKGLVAYYFGDKEGYEAAVSERFFSMVRQALEANLIAEPAAALQADIDIVLDMIERYPGAMRATSSVHAASTLNARGMSLNAFTVERLSRSMGVTNATPLLAAVLGSWGIHAVDLALRQLDSPTITRADVRAVLLAEIRAAVATLAVTRPELSLNPGVFSG